MNVGDLSLERFATRLAKEGVAIRWGPFVSHIVSKLPELAAPIHLLYADFPIEPPGSICDFHICARPRSLRLPWSGSQAEVLLDGAPLMPPYPRRWALPMFEWGLNACVYRSAHQFLIIHGAVVERSGCALILPGLPGAGKSTLCAALVTGGWRLLSDELTLLSPADGVVQPLARPISLKNDSIEIIRRLAPDWTFGPTAIDTHKGAVAHLRPPTESSRRNKEPACPRWIVTPQFAPGRPLQLSPTSKGSTLISLGENSLNYEILGETGFRTMVRLIDRCDCYRLEHASAGEAVRALEDLVRGLPAEGRHAAVSSWS
jgi:HprK-related kinase A